MNKRIFIALLTTMPFAFANMANEAMAPAGAIGFSGKVIAATEAVNIGPNSDIQAPRSATRVSSQLLTNTKRALGTGNAGDLFDYFAGYAPVSAKVITVIYH